MTDATKVTHDHIEERDPAIRDITYGLPFCVCRMCRGLGCASCSKLGFMTRSQYSMVPEEFSDLSRVRVARA